MLLLFFFFTKNNLHQFSVFGFMLKYLHNLKNLSHYLKPDKNVSIIKSVEKKRGFQEIIF